MPVSADLVAHLVDTLAPLGPVRFRRMFGGGGLFRDGLMFAIIADDTLFLKADGTTSPAFEAEGLGPFVYETSGGERSVMSYWRAPERLLDDTDELIEWAGRAMAVAARASLGKVRGKSRSADKSAVKRRSKPLSKPGRPT